MSKRSTREHAEIPEVFRQYLREEQEHLTPIVRYGKDELENVAVACKRCNSRKHELTLKEWLGRYPARAGADRIREAIANGQAKARAILEGGS